MSIVFSKSNRSGAGYTTCDRRQRRRMSRAKQGDLLTSIHQMNITFFSCHILINTQPCGFVRPWNIVFWRDGRLRHDASAAFALLFRSLLLMYVTRPADLTIE